jgi:hypothetical protein
MDSNFNHLIQKERLEGQGKNDINNLTADDWKEINEKEQRKEYDYQREDWERQQQARIEENRKEDDRKAEVLKEQDAIKENNLQEQNGFVPSGQEQKPEAQNQIPEPADQESLNPTSAQLTHMTPRPELKPPQEMIDKYWPDYEQFLNQEKQKEWLAEREKTDISQLNSLDYKAISDKEQENSFEYQKKNYKQDKWEEFSKEKDLLEKENALMLEEQIKEQERQELQAEINKARENAEIQGAISPTAGQIANKQVQSLEKKQKEIGSSEQPQGEQEQPQLRQEKEPTQQPQPKQQELGR